MKHRTRTAATLALVMLLAIAAGGCSPGTPLPRGIGQSRPIETTEVPVPDASSDGPEDAAWTDGTVSEDVVAPERTSRCPEGMVLAKGDYCPEVEHTCLGYLDPPGRYHEYRCGEYASARCAGSRVSMEYCIDAREYTPPNQSLPAHFVSFRDAKRICGDLGKRVCLESEWNFACEGAQMLPYPYGSKRDASICNLFRPRGMTEQELSLGCRGARERFHAMRTAWKRFWSSPAHRRNVDNAAVFWASNIVSALDIRAKSGLRLGKGAASR